MSKIKIMCTSTGCIEYAPERYRNLGIDIIRIHVHFNGHDYKEGLDLDPVAFYNQLETLEDPKNHLPYTDMPDTEDICGLFEKAIADGYEEVIAFALSSALGGTYNKICLLAREYEDKLKIHVIDTKITCFGEGLLAIKAAEFAAQGMSSEDILKEILEMMAPLDLPAQMYEGDEMVATKIDDMILASMRRNHTEMIDAHGDLSRLYRHPNNNLIFRFDLSRKEEVLAHIAAHPSDKYV